jgi:hypothetical protein
MSVLKVLLLILPQTFVTVDVVSICRVARWFVFKPKIQIWVNFGGSWNGRCWYVLWTLRPFYSLLLYFMDILYSLFNLLYIYRFGILYQEKIWQPWLCGGVCMYIGAAFAPN